MKKVIFSWGLILFWGCSSNLPQYWDQHSFYKPAENPILSADSTYTFFCPVKHEIVRWQQADVFNPAAIVKDNKVYLLYRSEDNPVATYSQRTSRIGLAISEDGIHFEKYKEPVLYPDSSEFLHYDYPGGCEDPRVVETEDGLFVLTYTSWNLKTARLSIAFSRDLIHWEKKGPAFASANDGKFLNTWSKSGSIITRMIDGKPVVQKINEKYWMYWGEYFINLAWSYNLIDWYPLLDENGELKKLVAPRPGKFDSDIAECGPPALITNNVIVLLYNGKNATDENAFKKLPKGTYTVGRVLFDTNDPKKIISRTDSYILKPTLSHEITGPYKAGTVFAEGLVFFQNNWFLYYGTADSYVGLAISK